MINSNSIFGRLSKKNIVEPLIFVIIILLITPTQLLASSMIEYKVKTDNECFELKSCDNLDMYSIYQNHSLHPSFRLFGFISNPKILHSDSSENIYSLQFNAEKIYCTTIEPPSYTHGALIKNKIYDAQQTIIIPITTLYEFDTIPISFIGLGALLFCTNHFIIAKSPFYSMDYLFALLFGGWNAFYPESTLNEEK